MKLRDDKWEEKGKQVNQLVNSLCQTAKIPFIDNKNVTKDLLIENPDRSRDILGELPPGELVSLPLSKLVNFWGSIPPPIPHV